MNNALPPNLVVPPAALTAFHRGLPKWPQMVVKGHPIPRETALEIIRRTDTLFQEGSVTGSRQTFANRLAERLRFPPCMTAAGFNEGERLDWSLAEAWRAKWGVIVTEYVRNRWLASPFIEGPRGWCSPDGRIAHTANIGKYPSIDEVARDWCLLAAAFPVLDLQVTLMDREESEEGAQPVVVFRVREGVVTVVDPTDAEDWGPRPPVPPVEATAAHLLAMLDNPAHGRDARITADVLDAWEAQARALFPETW